MALAGVDVRLHVARAAGRRCPLPARAVEMIVAVLTAMAERKPISLIPPTAELTAQQAADFLDIVHGRVLVELLEKKQIPHGWWASIAVSASRTCRRSRKNLSRDAAGSDCFQWRKRSGLSCLNITNLMRDRAWGV